MMLFKQAAMLEHGVSAQFQRWIGEQEVSTQGAFPSGVELLLRVRIGRQAGVRAVVLRLRADGVDPWDIPFLFEERCGSEDSYVLTQDTAQLCGTYGCGLFFYELLFLRGEDTLFSNSINNVDFTFATASANPFRLLLYRADFTVPAWLGQGVMYHVFLDRFCRGQGEAQLREGAELNTDWQGGMPQFPKHRGGKLSNNVFFGGNLWGVIEKLPFLESLGVTVLYLSPIFASASNHRYDTGDYEQIDALLGGREAFDALVSEAHQRGMRILLDGVFNHTGDDSRYFNRYARYDTYGAYQSPDSPYADWYHFIKHPDKYECWWGIDILPRLNHENDACRHYFTGADGIAAKWMRAGADGWRLDVADELSDCFLEELRETVQQASNGQAVLIGEVWENAADKMAYGKRRHYFLGKQLDSVMNYPFRNAVLGLLLDQNASLFYDTLTELYASYPPQVSHSLMNLIGTHDTERILTLLGGKRSDRECSNEVLATKRLSKAERARGIRKLKIAALLQFTAFGIPSIYYGDEVGMEGYHDPFCRMPYPWGNEDEMLLAYYRELGNLRKTHSALNGGDFRFLYHDEHSFVYERSNDCEQLLVAVHVGNSHFSYPLDQTWNLWQSDRTVQHISLRGENAVLLYRPLSPLN